MLNPILIDTATFTHERQQTFGEVSLRQLDERVWSHELLAKRDSMMSYRASGGIDHWQRPFIDISINADLQLTCQRCLQAVSWTLDDQAHIVLFADESQLDEAMAADETAEGTLWVPEINLTALVEDQILMALPFSPRHERCTSTSVKRHDQNPDSPFAQLATLKSGH